MIRSVASIGEVRDQIAVFNMQILIESASGNKIKSSPTSLSKTAIGGGWSNVFLSSPLMTFFFIIDMKFYVRDHEIFQTATTINERNIYRTLSYASLCMRMETILFLL